MKIITNASITQKTQSILFGVLLIALIPALLILDRFKVFLIFIMLQFVILGIAFYDPLISLALHLSVLFILTLNSLRESL